jgi:hypothetical protein
MAQTQLLSGRTARAAAFAITGLNGIDYTEIFKSADGLGIVTADPVSFYSSFTASTIAALDRAGNFQVAGGLGVSGKFTARTPISRERMPLAAGRDFCAAAAPCTPNFMRARARSGLPTPLNFYSSFAATVVAAVGRDGSIASAANVIAAGGLQPGSFTVATLPTGGHWPNGHVDELPCVQWGRGAGRRRLGHGRHSEL